MPRPVWLIALLALLPMPALADDAPLPELFSVVGVAANDKLNIRTQPSSTAELAGQLDPDAKDIEVVASSADGEWAQINQGEISGWVARRFMQRSAESWKENQLPAHLSCYGTEPFWSMRYQPGKIVLAEPGKNDRVLELRSIMGRGFEKDRLRGVVAADDSERLTAIIQPALCSDGMSDRQLGLNATLILDHDDKEPRLLSGCCSIAPK